MSSRAVVLHRYRKDFEKTKNHVLYIGFRARETEQEERGHFDAEKNHGVAYRAHLDRIQNDPALQHPSTVKSHSVILSVTRNDFEGLKAQGISLKDIAREWMSDLEKSKGLKIDWLAAVHEKGHHPHVHISMSGIAKDESGRSKRLYIGKDEYSDFRKRLEQQLERYNGANREHTLTRTRGRERATQRPRARELFHPTAIGSLIDHPDEWRKKVVRRSSQRRNKRMVSRIEINRQSERSNS